MDFQITRVQELKVLNLLFLFVYLEKINTIMFCKILLGLFNFIVKNGTVIVNVILAVSLFYAGLYFNKRTEEKKEVRRLEKLKEYFLTLIDIQITVTLEQASYYHETALNLKKIGNDKIMIRPISGTPHSSILSINRQDLYEIFVNKDNIKEDTKKFNKIVSGIEYLNTVTQEVKSSNEKLRVKYEPLVIMWNENNNLVNIEIDKLEKLIASEPSVANRYTDIVGLWRKNAKGLSIQKMYNDRVKVLLSTISQQKKDENTIMLYRYLDKLGFTYFSMKKLFNEAESSYERTYITTNNIVSEIKRILDKDN